MINLMFCGNDKVFDGMIISLLSIVKHCKEQLNIYILTMDLQEINKSYRPITKEQVKVLEDIILKANSKSKINIIDITSYFKEEMLESVNINTHYTPYILVRLFSDKIEELPDKVLYLDSDLVIYKDIKPLFDTKIDNYDFAAVVDYIGQFFINKKYINSGVLLMNIKKMKEEGKFEKCRNMVITKKMLLPDQTALNEICEDKIYLPRKYNEQKEKQEDTVIRHFSMTMKIIFHTTKEKRKIIKKHCSILKFIPFLKFLNIKPWNIEAIHKVYDIHDFDDILEHYLNIKKEGELKNE